MARWLLVCSAAAIVATAGSGAIAQPVAQSSYTHADVSSFKGTNDTLVNAITNVQQATGGRVLEIRFSGKNGMSIFHAVVAKGKNVVFLKVATEGGVPVEISGKDKPDWALQSPAKAQLQAAQSARVSLVDAVRTAEKSGEGGPAVAAGIATSAANTMSNVKAYNVLVLQGAEVKRVAVDDSTGQVITDPSALSGWP
jgi:hypothetical protein